VKQDEALNKPLPKPQDYLSPEQQNMQKMLYDKISQGLTSQPQAYPGALTFGQTRQPAIQPYQQTTQPAQQAPVQPAQQYIKPPTGQVRQMTGMNNALGQPRGVAQNNFGQIGGMSYRQPNQSPVMATQPQLTGAALGPIMQQPKTPMQLMPQPVPQVSEAPLTSLENMARQNIISRMQNPSGISPDIEQAMYDRATQRIKEEAEQMKRNLLEDYNRRGLLQSGILSGALDRADKNTLDQLSNISKDIAIRNSDITRQEGWNALNALLGFAGTERNIGQGALDRERAEWLRQQGAGNDALSQAMAFAGMLAPQGQQSYQAALNQQAMQTQAQMNSANQWGQLGGYLLAPYLQNIWGTTPMSTIPI
jgi:hypothetical protein